MPGKSAVDERHTAASFLEGPQLQLAFRIISQLSVRPLGANALNVRYGVGKFSVPHTEHRVWYH